MRVQNEALNANANRAATDCPTATIPALNVATTPARPQPARRSTGGWSDKASFAREMRRGLATGEVFVAYQPIVELASGEVRKVEAIARWTHPERGDVPPPCSSRSPNHSI